MSIMRSKNGGSSAWEPAGAQDWLEVSTLTYWSVIAMFIWIFMHIYSLLIIIYQWKIYYLFFPFYLLNPLEFLGGIVIEHEYVECTASTIQALVLFKKSHPEHRKKETENSIQNAVGYILDIQMPDGSWYVHVLVY